jgi:hypothetical protein
MPPYENPFAVAINYDADDKMIIIIMSLEIESVRTILCDRYSS